MVKRLLWIAAIIIALDQLTKIIARKFLPVVYNEGASFGILQGKQLIFIIASIVVIGVILFCRKHDHLAFPFILGGATGNLIDRIFLGAVTDFIHVPFFSPWFNVADIANTIGGVLLVLSWVQDYRKSHNSAIQAKE
ncbi:MAG TPA: signal peptidase II [Candidatus Nanoarchaeia archaeon]|nr:signal peptidase II [Candidatus Nanoarchaeia archaeon]